MSGSCQISFSFRLTASLCFDFSSQPGGKEAKRKQKLMKGFALLVETQYQSAGGCAVWRLWPHGPRVRRGQQPREGSRAVGSQRTRAFLSCAWFVLRPTWRAVSPPTHAWMLLSLNCQILQGAFPVCLLKQEG